MPWWHCATSHPSFTHVEHMILNVVHDKDIALYCPVLILSFILECATILKSFFVYMHLSLYHSLERYRYTVLCYTNIQVVLSTGSYVLCYLDIKSMPILLHYLCHLVIEAHDEVQQLTKRYSLRIGIMAQLST